jgi:hypothetical protein
MDLSDNQVGYRTSLTIMSLLQKSVTFARLLQFLRLKPYETCIFQRLLLQNWSFATASNASPFLLAHILLFLTEAA